MIFKGLSLELWKHFFRVLSASLITLYSEIQNFSYTTLQNIFWLRMNS